MDELLGGIMMKILLTNDDGIYAKGINVLREALQDVEEVFVVAPDRERSATGHAITMHKPLFVREEKYEGSNAKGWSVNGTPSDCVKIAIEALLPQKPDLVISGINFGPNLGTDVLYSGTVSAAIESIINGIPAIAISLASYDEPEYTAAAHFAKNIVQTIKRESFPVDTLLNINVPPGKSFKEDQVAVTCLGTRRYQNSFDKRVDPRGRTYYWLAGEVIENNEGIETDVGAIKNGYISITPLHLDLTNYPLIEEIKKWKIGN